MAKKILTAGNKRTHSFWNNDMSLTSKRGGVLLSNRKVAKKLAVLARELKGATCVDAKGTTCVDAKGSFEITNKALIKQIVELKK